uniref:WD_REPEATS_REGION domain-containing protein n=1 Tax=Elaeophora elaphi TaxID=1147741 RepID=A0A0R3RS17_9BILA
MNFSFTSVTDNSKRSEIEQSSFIVSTSSSKSDAKLADKCHKSVKTNFDLGNNNTLSISKSKTDPNVIIYDLQDPNGCKIHLEKMANRAMLLSMDDTGKRLYISCNF